MEPLSARLPNDLYLWLARLQVDGATTTSDKLRVLLGQLKRQHDGALDYAAAHAWARDLSARLRDSLVRIEGAGGRHSDVLSQAIEQLTGMIALLVSRTPASPEDAAALEDALVRRVFALTESLLRQATTDAAAAYDPAVVRRHLPATVELAAHVRGTPT